jgi:hypothetical protein
LGFETALQEKIAETLDEFFQIDGVGRFAHVFAIFNEFHDGPGKSKVDNCARKERPS